MKREMEEGDSGGRTDSASAQPRTESEGSESDYEKRISDLEKKNEEYLDRLKRLQADFDNYKKRMAKEREEYCALATERIIRELLGLLDDFERAIANSKGPDEKPLADALEMMHKQLKDILKKEGVVEITTDCKLDPFEHEAMSKVDQPGKQEGDIVECLQKGYKIGNKVIRPARVVVCHREEGKEAPTIKDTQKLNLNDQGYIDTDE
ncbi:MAG: nucleotide exchange factor GrpE [Thermoplasmata archaeon]